MKLRYLQALLVALIFCFCIINLTIYIPMASAFDTPLRTEKADAAELKGSFTVIFYGGRFSDDLETFAILDLEGDQYHFEPFAPDFDYRVKKGVPSTEALREAERFVSFHNSFWRSQLSRILDKEGNVIGYELRPLYMPLAYGRSDVMDVSYWIKEGGRVKVTVRLIPAIEKLTMPGGELESSGGD